MTVEGLEEITVGAAAAHSSNFRHLIESVLDFGAGTVGGLANCLVAQPFDTVKVKLQTFPADYGSTYQCFSQTFHRDGLARGLYAGMVPALMAHVAENAVLFTFYGLCQKTVMRVFNLNSEEDMSVVHCGLSGSGASLFSSLVLCPTELVKCRLQASRNMLDSGRILPSQAHTSTVSLCRHIVRTEGLSGFYRGLSGTIIREMPGYFCFFGGYELTRTLLTPEGKTKNEIGPLRTMVSGGMGGVSIWMVIYPIDSIKSRQQVYTHIGQMKFWPTLHKIIETEGPLALYRGLSPTILRTFLATGALFFTYENTKSFFKSKVNEIM